MKCDIIIVTWNAPQITESALRSIADNTDYPYRIIVVDNASDAHTVELLREAERSKRFGEMLLVENSENLGWVRGVNRGLEVADAPYVCMMNNDIMVGPNWLGNIIATMERESRIGLANPCERRENRAITQAQLADYAQAAQRVSGRFAEIDYCSGFCMVIRREVLQRIGHLDEAFGFGYYEDEDFSRRALEAGYLCVRCYDAFAYHLGSQSFGKDWTRQKQLAERNRRIYEQRWGHHKHVLVLARYPAEDELLRLARDRHILFVAENRYINRHRMSRMHENIRFRGSWVSRLFGPVYFLFKAAYLYRRGRIQSAVIKYCPEIGGDASSGPV
jgi:GT2 family glycosyltransferase